MSTDEVLYTYCDCIHVQKLWVVTMDASKCLSVHVRYNQLLGVCVTTHDTLSLMALANVCTRARQQLLSKVSSPCEQLNFIATRSSIHSDRDAPVNCSILHPHQFCIDWQPRHQCTSSFIPHSLALWNSYMPSAPPINSLCSFYSIQYFL